jgi:hypothetical protein
VAPKTTQIVIALTDRQLEILDRMRGKKTRAAYAAATLVAALVSAAAEQERLATAEDRRALDCPHPPIRVHKGLCHSCGTYVGTGKT